jgi:hypothetical protein
VYTALIKPSACIDANNPRFTLEQFANYLLRGYFMKKIVTALYLCATLITCVPQPIKAAPDYRAPALVVLGSLIATAGVYTLCKENKSTTHKIGCTIAGLTLVSLGGAAILFSKDIVREFDGQVLSFRWNQFKRNLSNLISD